MELGPKHEARRLDGASLPVACLLNPFGANAHLAAHPGHAAVLKFFRWRFAVDSPNGGWSDFISY